MRLTNKKALITGGTSGIGLSIAKGFVKEGAQVAVFGKTQESVDLAKEQLPNSIVSVSDVSRMEDLDRVYDSIKDQFGQLDVLVICAGVFKPTLLGKTNEADYYEIMDINTKGAFFSIQKALPLLNPGSSVILIASTSGRQGCADFSVYNASKAALISLAQTFAADLLPYHIRVNSISPGFIRTPLQEKAGITPEIIQQFEKAIPLKRFGNPEEIANVAVFLASEESSYITGTDIIVDGGLISLPPV